MNRGFLIAALIVSLSGAVRAADFSPQVTPATPPELPASPEVTLPPAAPPAEFTALREERGLFGWRRDAELGGQYLLSRSGQYRLLGIAGAGLDLKFYDPLYLGRSLGLAEDAVEYRLGLGLLIGYDLNNEPVFPLPCDLGVAVYLKERSLFDLDPFFGLALNLNLLGTDWQSGGLGARIYGGVLWDLGLPGGRSALTAGYSSYRIGAARTIEGYFFSLAQPLRL